MTPPSRPEVLAHPARTPQEQPPTARRPQAARRPLAALARAAAGVRWYLREFSGEAKWDRYLDDCASRGVEPLTRRQYERHLADHREHSTQARCC